MFGYAHPTEKKPDRKAELGQPDCSPRAGQSYSEADSGSGVLQAGVRVRGIGTCGYSRIPGRGWDVRAECWDLGYAAERGLAFGDPDRKVSPCL